MSRHDSCIYCEENKTLFEVLIKVCSLEQSNVYLCKDQTLPGRCVIACKEHYDEIFLIPKKQRDSFMDEVCLLAGTIKELFGAAKINYGMYGDKLSHVHFTLCPKFPDKLGWGKPFIMYPDAGEMVTLSENEYQQRAEKIRSSLMANKK